MNCAILLALASASLLAQTLTPSTVTLGAGALRQFTASASCSWSATLGSITPSGLYQAPFYIWSAETDTVTCGAGSAQVTLTPGTVHGLTWLSTNGKTYFLNPSNPLYLNTSSAILALDFDPKYFQTVASVHRAGQSMLSFIPPSPSPPSPLLNVALSGTIIGTQPTLNLLPGNGITWGCVNDSAMNSIDCTPSINFAVALAIAIAQSGVPIYCNSVNGTTAYTCSLSGASALTAYTSGMVLFLNVDTTCSGSCTLNVDNLGSFAVKQIDGATDPGGFLIASQPRWIAFNGTVWLLIQ